VLSGDVPPYLSWPFGSGETDKLAVGTEIDAVNVVVVQKLDAFRARLVGEQGGEPDDGPRAETRIVQQLAERLPDMQMIRAAFRLDYLAALRSLRIVVNDPGGHPERGSLIRCDALPVRLDEEAFRAVHEGRPGRSVIARARYVNTSRPHHLPCAPFQRRLKGPFRSCLFLRRSDRRDLQASLERIALCRGKQPEAGEIVARSEPAYLPHLLVRDLDVLEAT
jgi:hypothetical protein